MDNKDTFTDTAVKERDDYFMAHANNFPASYIKDHQRDKDKDTYHMTGDVYQHPNHIDSLKTDDRDDGYLKDLGFIAAGKANQGEKF